MVTNVTVLPSKDPIPELFQPLPEWGFHPPLVVLLEVPVQLLIEVVEDEVVVDFLLFHSPRPLPAAPEESTPLAQTSV